jgi:hypothetical protein
MDLGPCCPASKSGLRHIVIKGSPVGINGLDQIIEELKALDLTDEARIKQELVDRVKAANYVPKSVENDYKEALFRVYRASV